MRPTTELLHAHPFLCPLCGAAVAPGQFCPTHGPWWQEYGLRTSAAPFMIAAELLPNLYDRIRTKQHFNVLDVGGGQGICGDLGWKNAGRTSLVVVDAFDYGGLHGWPSSADTCIVADGCDVGKLFKPRSFDVVVATEVIEHVPKERGDAFLDALASVCNGWLFVTCPNGYTEQHANGPWGNNPHQEHKSGWLLDEFLDRGWSGHANGITEDGRVAAYQVVAYRPCA